MLNATASLVLEELLATQLITLVTAYAKTAVNAAAIAIGGNAVCTMTPQSNSTPVDDETSIARITGGTPAPKHNNGSGHNLDTSSDTAGGFDRVIARRRPSASTEMFLARSMYAKHSSSLSNLLTK